jgi:leucyl/phenylalanyl-tRNA---protein transferase
MPIFALSSELTFPPPRFATREGLLAFGGDLSEERLLLAYRMGIFPWYSDGEPILWWSPDPRLVLYPREFHLSRSTLKVVKRGDFTITLDTAFDRVIAECGRVRRETGEGTWLVAEMIDAYRALHRSGFAHSVEAWQDGKLAGGLYGVSLGLAFFGESMFARVSNASKVALAGLVAFLVKAGFELIDCQVTTGHLQRMGACEISRKRYLLALEHALEGPTCAGKWALPEDALACYLTPKRTLGSLEARRRGGRGRKKLIAHS